MDFINKEFLKIIQSLLEALDQSQNVLERIETTGSVYSASEIIDIFNTLFEKKIISKHIKYKISLVGKSTHSLEGRTLNKANANRHIILNLDSEESRYIDSLYENRISDLLKLFKYLFSTIENFAIIGNTSKIEKYKTLIDLIEEDIKTFIAVNSAADINHFDTLSLLKEKEIKELQKRQDGKIFKSNWQLYVNLILDNGIEYIYHFTDKANLDMIRKMDGLYSWEYCNSREIEIPFPGGNELSRSLDRKKGAENYVRFSFCKNHPMKYIAKRDGRIKNPIILNCDTELIYLIGTKYCNMNATKNEAIISDDIEYFEQINFSICKENYLELKPLQKSQYQSEVLVFEHVPLKFILNLNNL